MLGFISLLVPILGPIAMAVGISANRAIRFSDGRMKGKGLADAGIALGLCATLMAVAICAGCGTCGRGAYDGMHYQPYPHPRHSDW